MREREVECTVPNDGAVNVTKTIGCSAIRSGTPFIPPAAPAMIMCHVSPLYS